jgi:putative nucleotidyltransferase with HDIG domain
MPRNLVDDARLTAEEFLIGLPRRLAHTRGVGARAAELIQLLDAEHPDEVVAAAWLHDIGYAESLHETGFHPVDGARFARAAGFSERVASLIAHHTGAAQEATERNLTAELAEFSVPDRTALDIVTYADLTTSPDGLPVTFAARVAEILQRYEPGNVVHRAVTASTPAFQEAIVRVNARLRSA